MNSDETNEYIPETGSMTSDYPYLLSTMFSYQLINHPVSFILDESRIAQVFELVSEVPHCSRHSDDRKNPGSYV